MPNYILSRTSPPAHIYERKINLGYGVKVDVSDAPQTEPKKEKNMNDAKEVLDVADKPDGIKPGPVEVAYIDGTPVNAERIRADLEAKAAEEAEEYPPFSKQQV